MSLPLTLLYHLSLNFIHVSFSKKKNFIHVWNLCQLQCTSRLITRYYLQIIKVNATEILFSHFLSMSWKWYIISSFTTFMEVMSHGYHFFFFRGGIFFLTFIILSIYKSFNVFFFFLLDLIFSNYSSLLKNN